MFLLSLCYCMGMVGNAFIMCLMVVMVISSWCFILSFFCPLWITLIIVFLGGMMVMFSYVSSMSSGEKVWSQSSMKSSVLLLSSVMLFSVMKSEFNLSLMYLHNNMMVLILCTFYLLFCLFLVVKMVEGCLVN